MLPLPLFISSTHFHSLLLKFTFTFFTFTGQNHTNKIYHWLTDSMSSLLECLATPDILHIAALLRMGIYHTYELWLFTTSQQNLLANFCHRCLLWLKLNSTINHSLVTKWNSFSSRATPVFNEHLSFVRPQCYSSVEPIGRYGCDVICGSDHQVALLLTLTLGTTITRKKDKNLRFLHLPFNNKDKLHLCKMHSMKLLENESIIYSTLRRWDDKDFFWGTVAFNGFSMVLLPPNNHHWILSPDWPCDGIS